jgi:hypothetical protein
MQRNDDAFDRVVERERVLRERAALFDSPKRLLKVYWRVMYALGLVWGVILVVHWTWWSPPHWLVVIHTIAFGLGSLARPSRPEDSSLS